MMTPLSGTGRNGRSYPYYCCSNAEKFSGTVCPCKYVPAQSADRAVIEFMKKLVLKPDIVDAFAKRANDSTSGTRSRIKADLDRVRQQLATVRAKIGHFLDAIGEAGKTAMASVKERLQELEREREELEASEARLKTEHEAEGTQEIIVQHQIESLKLFNQVISQNEDQPDRLKSLIPRFVEYVIWRTLEKGEGTIEVALFPAPVALAPDAIWDDSKPEAVGSSQTRGWYPRKDLNLQPSD
ncbi:MAG: recombinase zinc beta ribbon domain-containing protein [Planctomycetes bacterium]|nr:recombinase zinc beta ribbon domain-containing protein [Planctomycetota bacterium]